MDLKIFVTIFVTVFVAELGDKTQIATLLYASDKDVNKLMVFFAASSALIATSALGVLAGGLTSQYMTTKHLNVIAGIGFILVGVWTILKD